MTLSADPAPSGQAAGAEIRTDSKPQLSLVTRSAYGLGDFANTLVYGGLVSWLALFYTDAVGIGAGVAGIIIVTARVVDGFFDPVVGAISERTRSKYGRFRPWILYGMLPLGIFSVLTFTAPFPGDSVSAIVWAAATYGILGLVYSCVNLPYAALSGVIAETQADRLSLGNMRFVFASICLILMGLATLPLVNTLGTPTGGALSISGFTATVAIFAGLAVVLYFFVFKTSREIVTPVHVERPRLAETIRAVFTNGPLLVVFLLNICGGTAFFARFGVVAYYYIYNSGNAAIVPILISTTSIASLVGTLLFTRLAHRIGKRRLFIIGQAVQAAALFALYLSDPTNIPVLVILTVVNGLAGFTIPLLYAMVADVADYGELKSGVRNDGIAFAVVSLSQKLGAAISGIAVTLLGVFGYVANQVQTPEATHGINVVVNLLPALLGVVTIFVALLYPLTDKRATEIRNELKSRAQARGQA
ncbi:MFS transporter [Arthrobacter sp. SD76]|uniref:MFS transporter n=1 Tax=Arthrobacter sp. SD76 TaxID=3415007 RepID=UPI003C734BE5